MSSQHFGRLTVLRIEPGSKDHHRVAECRCVCGEVRRVRFTKLERGLVVECAKCALITARLAGRLSRRKLSPRERAIRNAFGEYKGNAKRKGISFNLTLDQFRGFVIAPCAYCGIHPVSPRVGGIDRQLSTGGYERGNVTSCCSECNYAKRDLTPQAFMELIERIYRWSCSE